VLDEAIQRLPEKYRLPIVLCYVQGKTNAQAADLLGWPKGTVVTRLARARQRLRAYLGRRGFAGSVAIAVTALSQKETMPAGLAAAAVRTGCLSAGSQGFGVAATTHISVLAEGALKSMWIPRLKLVTGAVLLIAVAATGGGVTAYQILADKGDSPSAQRPKPEAKPSDLPRETPRLLHPAADDHKAAAGPRPLASADRPISGLHPAGARAPDETSSSLPLRFVVPVSPVFEGGAIGVPTLFEVGIKCQRPDLVLAFDEELADQVRSGLVTTLKRLQQRANSTASWRCKFGVAVTPRLEGGADGEPVLYTVEINGQPSQDAFECFERELPDKVRAGVLKTVRRMRAKQASAGNPALEQTLDKLLDRLDVLEDRLTKGERHGRSSDRTRD
jgi:Sigma-70, region 4